MNMIKIHGMYVQSSKRFNKHTAILKSPFTRILLRTLILPTRQGQRRVFALGSNCCDNTPLQTHFQRKEGFSEKKIIITS